MKYLGLIAFVLILISPAFATVTEFNFTDVPYNFTYSNVAALNLSTGQYSNTTGHQGDISIFYLVSSQKPYYYSYAKTNNWQMTRLIGNLSFDCSQAFFPSVADYSGTWYPVNPPSEIELVWCMQNGTATAMVKVTGIDNISNVFNATVRYNDVSSWLGYPGIIASTLSGNYVINSSDFRYETYIDFDKGIAYRYYAFFGVIPYRLQGFPSIGGGFESNPYTYFTDYNMRQINATNAGVDCYNYLTYDYSSIPLAGSGWNTTRTFCRKMNDGTMQKFYMSGTAYTSWVAEKGAFSSLSGFVNTTDMDDVVFGFEGPTVSSTWFSGAAWHYSRADHQLIFAISNSTSLMPESTPANTLGSVNCWNEAPYSYGAAYQVNTSTGQYYPFCFNQSWLHGGDQYFGAIKVVNTQNVRGNSTPDFDFYYELYSPFFVTFSGILYSPQSPIKSQPITITWSTNVPMTTRISLSYLDKATMQFSVPVVFNVSNSLSVSHSAFINATYIPQATQYRFALSGFTSNNSGYTSDINYFSAQNPSTISRYDSFQSGIVLFPIDDSTGFSMPGQCSMNVIPDPNMTRMSPLIDTRILTLPTNISGQILQNYAWNYVTFDYSSFGGRGVHNVTCSSSGYFSNSTTINVVSDPSLWDIRLTKGPSCFKTYSWASSEFECVRNMNGTAQHPIAWYCLFDPDACVARDSSTGNCLQYGGYAGYSCDSCSAIPEGYTCNSTVGIGQQLNGTVSITGSLFTPIAGILGITTAAAQALIALIVSIAVGIFAGIKTKEGMLSVVVIIAMLTAFMIMGWLPFWLLFVLVVLAAFIVARFARGMLVGGG